MISPQAVGRLVVEAAQQWHKDQASKLAASLAFYTLFSLVPALVIVIAVAGFVFGREAAQSEIVQQIRRAAGAEEAETVQMILESASEPASRGAAAVFGVLIFLLGATAVFADLQGSINVIWKVPQRPGRRWRSFFWRRFLPFLIVFLIGLILAASLGVSAAVSAVTEILGYTPALPAYLWPLLDTSLSFVTNTLLFALIFKVLPDAAIRWSDVWIGAAATALLFTLGQALIGFYLGMSVLGSIYGKAGSLVVLLLWVYCSAQIFFFGAEFTHRYAEKYGSRILHKHAAPAGAKRGKR